jgi:hypothetical protein
VSTQFFIPCSPASQDFKIFVQVFVSFLFATEDEIGFDPTVHRVHVENKYRYVYEVEGRFFLTTRPMFNPRVLCITGRKTRVWSAVEVAGRSRAALRKRLNEGKEFAVKDVWLNQDSPTEREILSKIFHRLDNLSVIKHEWMADRLHIQLNEVLRDQHYKRYFMDIVCDQQGQPSRPVAEGACPDPQILDMTPRDQTVEEVKKTTLEGSTQSQTTFSIVSGRTQRSSAPQDRDYQIKQQYRLVYADVGTPLHNSPDLDSCFRGIQDAFIGTVPAALLGVSCSLSI